MQEILNQYIKPEVEEYPAYLMQLSGHFISCCW